MDNGTGMTQEIIERHLLNVGSSRYQDPKFRERHPNFSPISRFGIGVLSAFMVADSVQIVTFHEDETQGRQIHLRSVHGKYLIRLLDKSGPESKEIGRHGTKIVLRMRASAKQVNVLDTLTRWILFPRCKISARIDASSPQIIGFNSPRNAIEDFVASGQSGLRRDLVTVRERTIGGLTIAFATRYNPHFRDRQFVQNSEHYFSPNRSPPPVGVCIEGIRVEFLSPGFLPRSGLLAIVDCRGNDAPKTNVARSALESEPERAALATAAFEVYLDEVRHELDRLQAEEGFSLSYAVDQFPFIANSLYVRTSILSERVVKPSFRKFPMYMVEDDDGRRACSVAELHELKGVWIAESPSMSSLVELLKEATANVTCKQVAEFASFKGAPLPAGPLITNSYLSMIPKMFLETEFEIAELRAFEADRRVDARWVSSDPEKPRWVNMLELEQRLPVEVREAFRGVGRRVRESLGHGPYALRSSSQKGDVQLGLADLPMAGLDDCFAVFTAGVMRILPGTPIAEFLTSLYERSRTVFLVACLDTLASGYGLVRRESIESAQLKNSFREMISRVGDATEVDASEFFDAVAKTEERSRYFNPWSWARQESTN
jgi:molecular chaperone HtpG